MDGRKEAFNLTEALSGKYPVANMIFHNKTLILLTRHHSSNNQQIALLIGMAFIGGIAAGFLVRCIYYGIVKYFLSNMDQLAFQASQRPDRGNVNLSFVGDSFRQLNDNPPDYVTVIANSSTHLAPRQSDIKSLKESSDLKIYEKMPPSYISIVAKLGRVIRSASA